MPRLSCLVLAACDFLYLCDFHLLKREMSRLRHLDLRASGYAAPDEDRKIYELKDVIEALPWLTVRYSDVELAAGDEGSPRDRDYIRHGIPAIP